MKRYAGRQDPTTKNARLIVRFLTKHRKSLPGVLILTHDFPDPDTLASAYCLHYLLDKGFKIPSRIVYGGIIGRTENRQMVQDLGIPVHKLRPVDFRRYTKYALVDTQPGFQNNSFPKTKRATIVIDQHPSEEKPQADLWVLDPECGATSVLLARALMLMKIPVTQNVATALAYGILTDTLNLYRARREDIIKTYLNLMPYCDLKVLADIQHPSRSRSFFVTLGEGIRKAFVRRRLIASHLGWVESPELVAQVADFLLTYRRVNWSLCSGRYKGKLYVSLRSANPNLLAKDFLCDIFEHRGQAGGHGVIAGGSFRVSKTQGEKVWQEAEGSLTRRLLKRLRLPQQSSLHNPFRPK